MKRLNTSAKKQETPTKIHTKKALVPLFIVTLSLLGFMGYAATHAEELFREPIALPPGGQPSGGSGVTSNLYSVLSAGANASAFINPVLLGGKLIVPTLCFGTSSSSVDCMSSASGTTSGGLWGIVGTMLQNQSGKAVNVADQQVKNLAAPTDPHDAVRKAEFDAQVPLSKLESCPAGKVMGLNIEKNAFVCVPPNGGSGGGTPVETGEVTDGGSPIIFPNPGTSVPIAETYVYALMADSKVKVVDSVTDQIVTTIPVGAAPEGAAVSPDGSRVYVANSGDNSISVIDAKTNTVVDMVLVGTSPRAVVVSPDGSRVYVANYMSESISVIDTSTDKVVNTIPAYYASSGYRMRPSSLEILQDGTKLFASGVYSGGLTSRCLMTFNTVTNIVSGASCGTGTDISYSVCRKITPDGKFLLYPGSYHNLSRSLVTSGIPWNTVSDISSSGTTPGTPDDSNCAAITPDQKRIYIPSNTDSTSVDMGQITIPEQQYITSGTYTRTPIGESPKSVAITLDGKKLYMAGSTTLAVLNTDTNTKVATINLGGTPTFVAIRPNIGLSRLYFDGTDRSVVMDSNGNPRITYITSNGDIRHRYCDQPSCATYLDKIIVSTGGTTGANINSKFSATLDSNGALVVAYFKDRTVKIAKCALSDCATITISSIFDRPADDNQASISVNIRPGGYPNIAVATRSAVSPNGTEYDAYSTYFASCLNANCTSIFSGSPSIVTGYSIVSNVKHRFMSLSGTGLGFSTDGRPWIAVQDGTTSKVLVIHCGNQTCSNTSSIASYNAFVETVSSPKSVPAMTIDSSSGRPLLVLRAGASGEDVMYLRCGDDTCSSATSSVIDTGPSGTPFSMAINVQGGLPIIAYQPLGQTLRYVNCNDLSCAYIGRTNISTVSGSGNFATIAPGKDGFPFMTHATQSGIKYVKCSSIACQ